VLRNSKVIWVGGIVLVALLMPARAPVVSAVSGEVVPGLGLEHSAAYLLIAPLAGLMDYVSMLTIPQHLAGIFAVSVMFMAWRVLRRRRERRRTVRVLVEAGAILGLLVALLGFYAVGALVPRPMAALTVDDPDIVVVDFHSHTGASHDVWESFSIDRNRAWHRGAGYDVAYISDHDSIGPGVRAAAENPARAGDGTVLLPGREVRYLRQHVAILGTIDLRTARRNPVLDQTSRQCVGWPVVIQTIPNDIARMRPPGCDEDGGGVDAIELMDGDPKGLAQSDRERDRILALADSLDIALVASSNNHGWGSTAVAWSLLRIPGWRDMTPAQVGQRIEELIRSERRHAVEVVTYRRLADPVEGLDVAAAPMLLPLHFLASRSRLERLSWIAWILMAVGFSARLGTGRASGGSAASGELGSGA
jgi:hypothetical protein